LKNYCKKLARMVLKFKTAKEIPELEFDFKYDTASFLSAYSKK